MGLLSFLPLLAAAFACLGADAEVTATTMPTAEWAGTIGPVHASLAAIFLIATLKLVRGGYRR